MPEIERIALHPGTIEFRFLEWYGSPPNTLHRGGIPVTLMECFCKMVVEKSELKPQTLTKNNREFYEYALRLVGPQTLQDPEQGQKKQKERIRLDPDAIVDKVRKALVRHFFWIDHDQIETAVANQFRYGVKNGGYDSLQQLLEYVARDLNVSRPGCEAGLEAFRSVVTTPISSTATEEGKTSVNAEDSDRKRLSEVGVTTTEGFYSLRARETRYQIEPHFFCPAVLDRYKDHPHYVVSDTRVSRTDGAPDDVEPAMIQQYVWGFSATGEPCIVVILAHLCTLSPKEQAKWKNYELSSSEGKSAFIEKRYAKPMIYGEVPDTISAYDAIFLYVREMQRVFEPDTLFPNFDGRHPDFLAPIAYNTKRAMAEFAQDLATFLTVRLENLASRITSEERRQQAAEFRKREQSRNLLHLYFEEHGVMSQDIEDGLNALKDLDEWRNQNAHELVPAVQDQDYRSTQTELVTRVQRGLRAMLIAIEPAENAGSYRHFVLQLNVD